MFIEDFVGRSNSAKDIEELFSYYKKAMANLGFDRLVFSLLTDHLEIQEVARFGVAHNYPDDWVSYYNSKDFFSVDPVALRSIRSRSAFAWEDLRADEIVTEDQKEIMSGGKEAGLLDGIGIPLHSCFQAHAAIGAASSVGGVDLTPDTLGIATMLSHQFYIAYFAISATDQTVPAIQFTKRETEILKWSSKGLSKAEIADKLKLSVHTVDYHTRKILLKLNSPNITNAVFKAARYGYVRF